MNAPDNTGSTKRLLLDRIRDKIRLKHYSIRTETAYVDWIRRFVHFHHGRHPRELDAEQVEAFLSYLAVPPHAVTSSRWRRDHNACFYSDVLRPPIAA